MSVGLQRGSLPDQKLILFVGPRRGNVFGTPAIRHTKKGCSSTTRYCTTHTIPWHMSLSSDWGQMVNNADHRGPGPDRAHRPLSSTETWRISLLHCDCTSAVQPSERVPLSEPPCHWSALVRAGVGYRFQYVLNTSVAAAFEGRAAVGMEGEEVSISAVPAATHLPLSVTSYYFDTNTTCAVEYALHKRGRGGVGFHFQFYSRNGRLAGNYMQMKTVSIKHDPCVYVFVCVVIKWYSKPAVIFLCTLILKWAFETCLLGHYHQRKYIGKVTSLKKKKKEKKIHVI